MSSIRKVGARWRAEVRRQGVAKSKYFDSKGEAQQWAKITEQILTGDNSYAQSISFGEVCARYLKEQSQRKGARWESIRLHKLIKTLGEHPIGQMTPQFWKAWISDQAIKPASVRRELALISAVFRECMEWGYLSDHPLREVKKPKSSKPRDRIISDDEIEQINNYLANGRATSQQVRAAFNLALATGMRRGEILSLERSQIDLDRRFLRLNDTKNGDKRDVPLSTYAVEILTPWCASEGRLFSISGQVLSSTFRKVCRRLDIQDLTFHDTRHRAVMDLSKKLSVIELARVIGHRDLKSLMIYYHPTAEDLAKRLD